jgi:glycosyltransferase involved in cell wall biosynthesis
MTPIRVGFNLLFLKPGRVGGSEVYVQRVLGALRSEATDRIEVTVFVNRRAREHYPEIAAARSIVAPISGDSPPLRIAAESSWLARQTAGRDLDLVHHWGNTIPPVRTRPAVVTIHDLQPFDRPGDFDRIKGAYLRDRIRAAVRGARVVVAPSEYVRRSIEAHFSGAEGRIVVVPPPMPPRERMHDESHPAERHGISRPYFVYPAITHPHKNHVTLIGAFARLVASHPEARLVLTGGEGAAEAEVATEIRRMGLGDRVRRLGRLPRPELDALIEGATALVFPSRHEGYGLPLTEALALGCPVIASNATAVPEVVGDAGLLLDPGDLAGWSDGMTRLLDDDALRARLVDASRTRAASLGATEAARLLIGAYERAIG